jgi:hypothetical protein
VGWARRVVLGGALVGGGALVAHRRSVPGPALPARPALLPGGSLARNAQLAGMSSRLAGA